MQIKTVTDRKRGCGWRKEGGLYLMGGGEFAPCGKLPVPLDVCPCCGAGVKPARGWTWVNADALTKDAPCSMAGTLEHGYQHKICPLDGRIGRAGLLWIGEAYYKTPEDWLRESRDQGISRRIKAVPRGFEVGETWVLLAHRKAVPAPAPDQEPGPGIFQAFQPTEIQYVVTGKETDKELEDMWDRGVTPIRIERDEAQVDMGLGGASDDAE